MESASFADIRALSFRLPLPAERSYPDGSPFRESGGFRQSGRPPVSKYRDRAPPIFLIEGALSFDWPLSAVSRHPLWQRPSSRSPGPIDVLLD